MFRNGVLKKKRFPRILTLATLAFVVCLSISGGGAASAHAPDGSEHGDLIEGNTNQEDAGDAYITWDGDTISVHWHLTGDFAGAVVTNQFLCAGEYAISPANERCKPGQAPDGTVFVPETIGDDDWSFTYTGQETAFQLHISIESEFGSSLLVNLVADPAVDDDGEVVDDGDADADGDLDADGEVVDDGEVDDDGSVDDDGTVVENDPETQVLPRRFERKPLARTGSQLTVILAALGAAVLMLGSFLRFGGPLVKADRIR